MKPAHLLLALPLAFAGFVSVSSQPPSEEGTDLEQFQRDLPLIEALVNESLAIAGETDPGWLPVANGEPGTWLSAFVTSPVVACDVALLVEFVSPVWPPVAESVVDALPVLPDVVSPDTVDVAPEPVQVARDPGVHGVLLRRVGDRGHQRNRDPGSQEVAGTRPGQWPDWIADA